VDGLTGTVEHLIPGLRPPAGASSCRGSASLPSQSQSGPSESCRTGTRVTQLNARRPGWSGGRVVRRCQARLTRHSGLRPDPVRRRRLGPILEKGVEVVPKTYRFGMVGLSLLSRRRGASRRGGAPAASTFHVKPVSQRGGAACSSAERVGVHRPGWRLPTRPPGAARAGSALAVLTGRSAGAPCGRHLMVACSAED